MYTRIPWELVADLLGSADHTLGTTAVQHRPLSHREIDCHGNKYIERRICLCIVTSMQDKIIYGTTAQLSSKQQQSSSALEQTANYTHGEIRSRQNFRTAH
jgi:hypothetical protein